MYTDADKHLKDFNALNQYQQEEEEPDIWGEDIDTDMNEEGDEEDEREVQLAERLENQYHGDVQHEEVHD